jgi:hypothetical protein
MNHADRRIYEEQTSFGESPLNRTPPLKCGYPYHYFLIQDINFRTSPCCYFYNVPGHELLCYDETVDFMELWNSPAHVALRGRLKDGPLFKTCKLCQNQGKQTGEALGPSG